MHVEMIQVLVSAAQNPFDGVSPSLGPFGPLLKSKIGVLLGVAWALGMVYLAFRMVTVIASLGRAKQGGYGHNVAEQRSEALLVGGAIIALMAVPAIYGILVGI